MIGVMHCPFAALRKTHGSTVIDNRGASRFIALSFVHAARRDTRQGGLDCC